METKELKIQIPEGFEIDKENSTFEKIVFKKKGIITPRQCLEYMGISKDRVNKPDELEDGEFMTREEYLYYLYNDDLNAFGEFVKH